MIVLYCKIKIIVDAKVIIMPISCDGLFYVHIFQNIVLFLFFFIYRIRAEDNSLTNIHCIKEEIFPCLCFNLIRYSLILLLGLFSLSRLIVNDIINDFSLSVVNRKLKEPTT